MSQLHLKPASFLENVLKHIFPCMSCQTSCCACPFAGNLFCHGSATRTAFAITSFLVCSKQKESSWVKLWHLGEKKIPKPPKESILLDADGLISCKYLRIWGVALQTKWFSTRISLERSWESAATTGTVIWFFWVLKLCCSSDTVVLPFTALWCHTPDTCSCHLPAVDSSSFVAKQWIRAALWSYLQKRALFGSKSPGWERGWMMTTHD